MGRQVSGEEDARPLLRLTERGNQRQFGVEADGSGTPERLRPQGGVEGVERCRLPGGKEVAVPGNRHVKK